MYVKLQSKVEIKVHIIQGSKTKNKDEINWCRYTQVSMVKATGRVSGHVVLEEGFTSLLTV